MSFPWQPTPEMVAAARVTAFQKQCGCASFEELLRRSASEPAWFTDHLLRFLEIEFHRPYETVLDLSRGIEWPQWCVGGGLNISSSCLKPRQGTAIVWEGEEGVTRELSWADLESQVSRCAGGLRALGIGPGDAVGVHLPMSPEVVISLMALARIGAVAAPLFTGFGPAAIESRLRDLEAKAVITCDAFPRRGRPIASKAAVDQAVANCPSVRNVIVVRRTGASVPIHKGRDLFWDEMLAAGSDSSLHLTSAEDPLIAIYTSGTTGKPKGILHTHCGFPVKSAQDMALNFDIRPGDRVSWITDIGWMMGPWLIYGALVLGATLVLYDGAPDFPAPDRLWDCCARHRVTMLGISPTLVRALIEHGGELPRRHDLSALRMLGSTGEPWNPDPWWWLFDNVAQRRIPIINYSGGTECSGGILCNYPVLPIKPCGLAAPCLGIAADVVDDHGNSVRGSVGELVIRQPWIGQARGFWKDPERYLATYWSRFPGMWVHGDWAQIDDDGHWFILGRSDDTLKIAGKRVGPAEVESVLVDHPDVREAAVIGIPDELKGTAMVAFCIAARHDDALAAELKQCVADALGKPLRPERVHFVDAIPKTRNAKIMRRVIRAAYLGENPGDLTALENPAAVGAIEKLRPA
ncbi:MAG: AMP-binding protein [Bryobacteraceae bacterium]